MVMGAENPVKTIDPQGEIYTCPSCHYTDGFHVSFKMSDQDSTTAEIYLICPNCHQRLRIGWNVTIA